MVRADNFAIGCAGLRNPGDVGLALLISQFGKFGDVPVPFAGTAPAVVAGRRRDWAGPAQRLPWAQAWVE